MTLKKAPAPSRTSYGRIRGLAVKKKGAQKIPSDSSMKSFIGPGPMQKLKKSLQKKKM